MYDLTMIAGWIIHMLLLVGLSVVAAKKINMPKKDWPFLAFVLIWADVILAAQTTSIFHSLDSLSLYVPASILAMAGLFSLLWATNTQAPALIKAPINLDFLVIEGATKRKALYWTLGITLSLVFLFCLFIVVISLPDNADSIIYRLPRAFYYISNKSFLHPFDAIDKRLTFYPLNGVSLYIPMVLYALPGTFHNLPSLLMWLTVGYTAYRFARDLGADKLIALFATWLVLCTPNIMAQAVSTNDEILSAAALLVGFYMGWRWLNTGERSYILLMLTAIGISTGTKMHIIFLAPIIFISFCIAAWQIIKNTSLLKTWAHAIGLKTGALSIGMMLVMIVPFFIYNYLSCGDFYFSNDSSNEVLNVHGNIQCMLQNFLIYISQMIFAPIADLNIWPFVTDRQNFNNILNGLTNPLIVPFLSNDPALYHASYRFHGVTIPTSVRFVEFSLWAGFVWLLWPLQLFLIGTYKKEFPIKNIFLLIAATPLLWLIVWCITTLYMEGTATYFSYYLTVAAPAACLVFLQAKKKQVDVIRWNLIKIVALSSFLIVINIFAYSGFRSIPDIMRTSKWPFDWLLFEESVVEEIKQADKVRITFLHEKMPYFAFMHRNPRATYYDPYHPPEKPAGILQLFPVTGLNSFGFMPLKIPEKKNIGATYIGLIRGIGREAIFAMGAGVEQRHPTESNYIVLQAALTSAVDGYFAVGLVEDPPLGFDPDDKLEFKYEIGASSQPTYVREWDLSPSFMAMLPYNPNEYEHRLKIQVRNSGDHKVLLTQIYQLLGPGQWLPDGPEY